MNRATETGISVLQSTRPRSARSLPYGLRELAPLPSTRIFCGTLSIEADMFRLRGANPPQVQDVYFSFQADHALACREVSILGYLGERAATPEGARVLIIAMKVASHEAISLRAYELHQSGRSACAVENWLCAERELLER